MNDPLSHCALNTFNKPFACTPVSLWVRGRTCARRQQNLAWSGDINVIWFILSADNTGEFYLFQHKALWNPWYKSQYCCFWLQLALSTVLLLFFFKDRSNYINHMKFFPCVHNKPYFKQRSAWCQTSHTREWWESSFSPLCLFPLSLPFSCLSVPRCRWLVFIHVHLRHRDDNIYINTQTVICHILLIVPCPALL